MWAAAVAYGDAARSYLKLARAESKLAAENPRISAKAAWSRAERLDAARDAWFDAKRDLLALAEKAR